MATDASTGAAPASTGAAASTAVVGSTAVAGPWGADWRTRMAAASTDVERDLKQLERYESPEQIWKKARELEKRMSAGELKPTLPKNATAQEVAAWRKEAGIPETPKGYKITMPAGRETPKDDDAFLNAFLNSAHAANYTQEQVDSAIGSFYAEVDRQVESLAEAETEAVAVTEQALREEWGADYRRNKTLAEALLSRAPAGFREKFLHGYLSDHTPIRASTEAWKWLVQLEREINPAATVVPATGGDVGKTIAQELTNLKALMANQNSEYWKGPKAEGHQARYRQLIDAEEKLKAKAAA